MLNPGFLGIFLGTRALCFAAICGALLSWSGPSPMLYVAGGILYVAGSFLVTIVCNVPRNESLAKVNPEDSDAEEAWATYVKDWTAWNHVRTIASLTSSACFCFGLTR